MCSYVAESVMLQLMEDSRVPLKLDRLLEGLEEEFSCLCNLGDPVWAALGRPANMSGPELRTEVLVAAHISIGFLTVKVVEPATQLPWSIGMGDVEANLASLKSALSQGSQ